MNIFTFAADESGDASFAFAKGASRYLCIAAISTGQPDALRHALIDFRSAVKLADDFEFKFTALSTNSLRKRVFTFLAEQEFEGWAVVVDKTNLSDAFKVMHGLEFYLFFMAELIRLIPEEKRVHATLILDEYGSPTKTKTELRRVLKARSVSPTFRQTRTARSHTEPLLQIADLVAGSIVRRDAKAQSEAFDLISSKMKRLLEYKG